MDQSIDIEAPLVSIPGLGILKGSTCETYWDNKTIYQFPCVKYGEPALGVNKFKRAEPVQPWTETVDTNKKRPFCVDDRDICDYLGKREAREIEDCLYLSVYSKKLSGAAPVMFFIGSSGYFDDKNEKSPSFLLETDIVLVIPSYRTGLLGFFSTKSKDIPGNAGLSDIILALKWVQNYIEHFGGDPKSVTVFGHGFGAALADALLISPDVPDHFFDKVILQSGCLLCPWAFEYDVDRQIKEIQWIVGIRESGVKMDEVNRVITEMKTVELLNKLRGSKLVNSSFEAEFLGMSKLVTGGYGSLPPNLVKAERKKKPLMIGVTKNDGSLAFSKAFSILQNHIDTKNTKHNCYVVLNYICEFLGLKDNVAALSGIGAKIFFSRSVTGKSYIKKYFHQLIAFCGTIMYKAPVFKTAYLHAEANHETTYVYSFDYDGKIKDFENAANATNLPFEGGVYHSYENHFLFPSNDLAKDMSANDQQTAKRMVDYWTSFATTGMPSSDSSVSWDPFTSPVGPVFNIDRWMDKTKYFPSLFVAMNEKQTSPFVRIFRFMIIIVAFSALIYYSVFKSGGH